MNIILTQDHDTLGLRGEEVTVKPGYARNYLIPRGLAITATKSSRKRFAEEQRQRQHKVEAQREQSAALADKLEGLELTIPVSTGEEGRLFGTVTTQQIADLLGERDLEVDRRRIVIAEEIKQTGVYTATVRVSPEHTAEVKVKVVAEESSL